MKLAWLTDLHLNFLNVEERRSFFGKLVEYDALAICGDIADSYSLIRFLCEMDAIIQKPIYFVLGNHDFYHNSVESMRLRVRKLTYEAHDLHYLTVEGIVELGENTAIIGHDGWADGKSGNFDQTQVILNDHLLIGEISQWYDGYRVDKTGLGATLEALAAEAADHFRKLLTEAARNYENVIAITHVPPYKEATWHEGGISDDNFLPYFSSQLVGDVLTGVMEDHPQCNLTVLCGHTHGGGQLQVLKNLLVVTGPSKYGVPALQGVLEIK